MPCHVLSGQSPTRVRSQSSPVVADQAALELVCEIRFSPVSIVPPMFHVRFYLNIALIGRTNERNVGTYKQSDVLSDI
jgi:hypothetical protein